MDPKDIARFITEDPDILNEGWEELGIEDPGFKPNNLSDIARLEKEICDVLGVQMAALSFSTAPNMIVEPKAIKKVTNNYFQYVAGSGNTFDFTIHGPYGKTYQLDHRGYRTKPQSDFYRLAIAAVDRGYGDLLREFVAALRPNTKGRTWPRDQLRKGLERIFSDHENLAHLSKSMFGKEGVISNLANLQEQKQDIFFMHEFEEYISNIMHAHMHAAAATIVTSHVPQAWERYKDFWSEGLLKPTSGYDARNTVALWKASLPRGEEELEGEEWKTAPGMPRALPEISNSFIIELVKYGENKFEIFGPHKYGQTYAISPEGYKWFDATYDPSPVEWD